MVVVALDYVAEAHGGGAGPDLSALGVMPLGRHCRLWVWLRNVNGQITPISLLNFLDRRQDDSMCWFVEGRRCQQKLQGRALTC